MVKIRKSGILFVTDTSVILTKTKCILHSSSMYVIFSKTKNIEVLKRTLDL